MKKTIIVLLVLITIPSFATRNIGWYHQGGRDIGWDQGYTAAGAGDTILNLVLKSKDSSASSYEIRDSLYTNKRATIRMYDSSGGTWTIRDSSVVHDSGSYLDTLTRTGLSEGTTYYWMEIAADTTGKYDTIRGQVTTTNPSKGTITSVAVDDSGLSVSVSIQDMDTGGAWDFNRSTADSICTDSTPFLYVKSHGYDIDGSRSFVYDTVYLSKQYRKNEPLDGYDSCYINVSDTAWVLVPSRPIFKDDTIKSVVFHKGMYIKGSDSSKAYTASTATNNSKITYATHSVWVKWTWPDHSVYLNDFCVSLTAYHPSARNGNMVRCVITSASDQHGHTVYDTLTSGLKGVDHPYGNDSLNCVEYRDTIPIASFTMGDQITVNAKVFPYWGDSVWTGDGINTAIPTPLYAPQYYLYDTVMACVVDSADGNDGTGVIALDTFGTTPTLAAFKNFHAAINAARTFCGSATIPGLKIYTLTGTYNYLGGTVTAGTVSSYWIEIVRADGETVHIDSAGGSTSFPGADSWIKLNRVHINAAYAWTIGGNELGLWLDSCLDERTAVSDGALGNETNCIYLTNCYLKQASDMPLSTNGNALAIIRGCTVEEALTFVPYCVIGNNFKTGNSFRLREYLTTLNLPEQKGSVIGWNRVLSNDNIGYQWENASIDHGDLWIGNVIESITHTGPVISISTGAVMRHTNYFVFEGNTIVGNRINNFYNDVGLSDSANIRYCKYIYFTNNIIAQLAVITDNHDHTGPAGNKRFGNWQLVFGIGCHSNIYLTQSAFPIDEYGNKYFITSLGSGEIYHNPDVNDYIKFVGDSSHSGSDAGGGDYHLQATSPAVGYATVFQMPYDIVGTKRGNNGSIGAYGYTGEGGCDRPVIGNITMACTVSVALSGKSITNSYADSLEWIDPPPAWLTLDTIGAGMGNLTGTPNATLSLDTFKVQGIGCTGDSLDTGLVILSVVEVSVPQYTMTMVHTGTGSTVPAADTTVDSGTVVNITATDGTNYHFMRWSSSTGSITLGNSGNASTTATVNGDGTVTAVFAINRYALTISRNDTLGGSVTKEADSADYGDTLYMTHTLNAGFTFDGWSGASYTNGDTAFAVMTTNRSVEHIYNKTTHKVFLCFGQSNMIGENGTGTPTATTYATRLDSTRPGIWVTYSDASVGVGAATPIPSIANYLHTNYNGTDIFGFLNVAVGGTGFVTTWSDSTSTEYQELLDAVVDCGDTIAGIFCIGGEQDAVEGNTGAQDTAAIKLTIANLRKHVSATCPIIFCKPERSDYNSDSIRWAFEQIEDTANGVYVACDDYALPKTDNVHRRAASLAMIGNRFAEQWMHASGNASFPAVTGAAGATYNVLVEINDQMAYDTLDAYPYVFDLSRLNAAVWSVIGDSSDISVIDQNTAAKCSSYVKIYTGTDSGYVVWNAPMSYTLDNRFVLSIGTGINSISSAVAATASGYTLLSVDGLVGICGYPGTIAGGAAAKTACIGRGIYTNGVSGSVTHTDPVIGTGNIMLESIFSMVDSAADSDNMYIMSNDSTVYLAYKERTSTPTFAGVTRNKTTIKWTATKDSFPTNQWTSYQVTSSSAGYCSLYVNKKLAVYGSGGTPKVGGYNLVFNNSNNDDRTFNGTVQRYGVIGAIKTNPLAWQAVVHDNFIRQSTFGGISNKTVLLVDGSNVNLTSLNGLSFSVGQVCTVQVDVDAGYAYTINGGSPAYSDDTLFITVGGDTTVAGVSYLIPVIDSIRDSTALRDSTYKQTGRPLDTMIAYGNGFSTLGDSTQINLNSTGSLKATIRTASNTKAVFVIPTGTPRGWYSTWMRTKDMIVGTPKYRALQVKRPGGS